MNFQGEAIVTVTNENGDEKIYKQSNTIDNNLLVAIYRLIVAGEKYPFTQCPGGIGLMITDIGTHSSSTAGFGHEIGSYGNMWLSSFASRDIQASGGGASATYINFAFSSSAEQEIITYTVDGIAGSELKNAGSSTITQIHLLGSKANYPFTSDGDTRTTFLGNITGLNISFATTDAIKIEYIVKSPVGRGDENIETKISGWSRRFLKGLVNTIARGYTDQDEMCTGVSNTRKSTNTLRICGVYLMDTTASQSSFATNDTSELANAGTAFTKAIPNTMNEFNSTTPTKVQASAHATTNYAIADANAPASNGALGTGTQVAYQPDSNFLMGTISLAPDTQTSSPTYDVTLAQTWTTVSNTNRPDSLNIYARRYDVNNNRFVPLNNVPPIDSATGGMDVIYRILPDTSSLDGWETGDNVTANLKFKVSALS